MNYLIGITLLVLWFMIGFFGVLYMVRIDIKNCRSKQYFTIYDLLITIVLSVLGIFVGIFALATWFESSNMNRKLDEFLHKPIFKVK